MQYLLSYHRRFGLSKIRLDKYELEKLKCEGNGTINYHRKFQTEVLKVSNFTENLEEF